MRNTKISNLSHRFHVVIICLLFFTIFLTDFLTPLGFAHGILYVPVLIYAMSIPNLNPYFQTAFLVSAIVATLLVYMVSPYRLEVPELYIASNRLLSVVILVLTYFYFRRLSTIKQQNIAISKLEESQRKTLEDFMNAMPIQVWWANPDGVVDLVGDQLARFTGKSKNIILENWLALLHPDDREKTVEVWSRSVKTGQPYHVDFRLQRQDGVYVWFHTQAVVQKNDDGKIIRWLGSSIDIDELRRLREEAERMAARYRHTVESITDAFFTLDQEFRFTYLNQKAAEIRGGTVEDFLGEVIWEKCQIGYHSPFGEKYRLAAQTKQKIHFEEYFSPGKKWLDVNVYPSPDGLTVYFSDITERKALEERLREAQKLEAVGHLTGGVAHDFNNLLTVIIGNAELLSEQLTDPAKRSMAEITLSAAQRGAELTSRLLAFARRKPLNPSRINVNDTVSALMPLIRRTLPENISLEFNAAPDLHSTEIDPGELDNALLNLVVNARDAMPDGGKLTIETSNTALDQHYARQHPEVTPGDFVMIAVSDNGVGMTAETLRRAFEPFFTTKAVGKGSGLGLSMVFGFTKQSGGHANIYSEPGEGTTIKLYFPRDKSSTQQPSYTIGKPNIMRGNEHILIAEDDELVCQHLERQLRLLGYQVTAVSSGPQALAVLEAINDIQLLLTDIIMPGGMNGRELADKACALYPQLKVLYTSGYTENAIVHHGRLDPGIQLLNKPYTRLELATKLRQVLDN